MKILFVITNKSPDSPLVATIPITSYPGVLFDRDILINECRVQTVQELQQILSRVKPHILVFQSNSMHLSLEWEELLKKSYPKLYIFATDKMDKTFILDKLNEKLWHTRRKVVTSSSRVFPVQQVNQYFLFSKMSLRQKKSALNICNTYTIKYDLTSILQQVSTPVFERIIYCLGMLERELNSYSFTTSHTFKVLDIGIKEWSYVSALKKYFDYKIKQSIQLVGLELDPYFYDLNGFTRMDHAQYYASLAGAIAREQDFLKFTEKVDFICCFSPIIIRKNATLWKIPLRYFQPTKFVEKIITTLKPGGLALIYCNNLLDYSKFLEILRNLSNTSFVTYANYCHFRQKNIGHIILLTV